MVDQRPKGQEGAAGGERRAKGQEGQVENRYSVAPPFVAKYVSHHDGKVLASPLHGEDELEENLKLGKILSEAVDDTVYLLPNINPKGKDAHLRGSYLPPGVKDGKIRTSYAAEGFGMGRSALLRILQKIGIQ